MNANPNIRAIDNSVEGNGGLVWHNLHSEREEICEVLLRESGPKVQAQLHESAAREEVVGAATWHRKLLQGRLCKIDDALDRLMSGSYGSCCKCGSRIEDTKLALDPAIAYCIDCWQRLQTKH